MSKCKRNIILIFGYLLIIVILFIPYISGYYIDRTAIKKEGYMFLPLFINAKLNKPHQNFNIKSDVLITEIALIVLGGGFAYILFCVVLRKEKERRFDD